MTPFGFVV